MGDKYGSDTVLKAYYADIEKKRKMIGRPEKFLKKDVIFPKHETDMVSPVESYTAEDFARRLENPSFRKIVFELLNEKLSEKEKNISNSDIRELVSELKEMKSTVNKVHKEVEELKKLIRMFILLNKHKSTGGYNGLPPQTGGTKDLVICSNSNTN